MEIISANNSHIQIIRDIASKSWPVAYAGILSDEQIAYMLEMMYSHDALLKQMNEQENHFLLIKERNSEVFQGFVSYEFNYEGTNTTKLHKLYVLPESHGLGMGRALVERVFEEARRHRNKIVSLNMNRKNNAVHVYKHLGFEIVGEEDINIGYGYVMEDYLFEKRVDEESEICVLFDMDGVVLDTETQYDKFWSQMGEQYHLGIPHFEKVIKGTTLPNIIKNNFSHLSQDEQDKIVEAADLFEQGMSYHEIAGALKFIAELKSKGIKIGLVTSSMQVKMDAVNKVQHFDQIFDTIVTGDRVVDGKPNPECFLLAAQDLGVDPSDCVVFEDSFAGIRAGQAAGMTVIALATTLSADELKDKTDQIIPNFVDFTFNDLEQMVR